MKIKSHILVILSLVLIFTMSTGRNILAQEAPTEPQAVTAVGSAITPVMSYQGRLSEGGLPVTGLRSMTFKLYTVSTSGTALWTETQSVAVANGLFQVALGSVTPFSEAVLMQMYQNLWLEINVAGTLLPRQQLMGAPYALSLAPGAVVGGSTARTLMVGNDGSGIGLWGHSETGHGLFATGNGAGLDGSALLAQANGPGGIAFWALNDSTDASLVVSNDGDGALVKGFGGNGGEHEFMITNDGTIIQALEANGLMKAAALVLCDDTGVNIVHAYNSISGIIDVSYVGTGKCEIDFHFPVLDRFYTVTAPVMDGYPATTIATCAMDHVLFGDTVLACIRQDHAGTLFDGHFMIVIY